MHSIKSWKEIAYEKKKKEVKTFLKNSVSVVVKNYHKQLHCDRMMYEVRNHLWVDGNLEDHNSILVGLWSMNYEMTNLNEFIFECRHEWHRKFQK